MTSNNLTPDIFSLSIPALAIDIVIFTVYKGSLYLLLNQRTEDGPEKGKYILPGGIVRSGLSLEENFDNILQNRTGIKGVYKEQLYTFGDVNRDPRGHVVSVTYYALVSSDLFMQNVDLTKVHIIDYSRIDEISIGYDHEKIIKYAKQRLDWKLEYTNIVKNILPQEFTLSRMQAVYESILDTKLDKRNFRKKIASLNILKDTGNLDKSTNRPAALYSFSDNELKIVGIL
ncbi:MAG: NUDIX hydrolase [Candidatus Gracilibacteria bacterium]|nr:NUDIX hydrolase [Candidatus Gracilibacteria bacterium]